ncbi:zinc finger protein basonuclin-2-like, partial [Centroberyx affinis]|uniref:zinc finger protein basonuclin-2-like n=1 Tax=Centroberyx affinis TaxID=166261 RepID=UPI003A5C01FB
KEEEEEEDDDGGVDEGREAACVRWLRSKRLSSILLSSMAELQGALAHTGSSPPAVMSAARSGLSRLLENLLDQSDEEPDNDKRTLASRLGQGLARLKPPQPDRKVLVSTLQQHFLAFSQRLHSAEVERRGLRLELANLKRAAKGERGRRHQDPCSQSLLEAQQEVSRKERSLRILGKHLSGVQRERRQLEERLQRAEEELRSKDSLVSYMKAAESSYREVRDSLVQSRRSLSAQPRPLQLPRVHLDQSGAERIMGGPEVAACQSLLSTFSELYQACSSRIGWLEQEVSAQRSHVTALRSELQDACLRDNLAYSSVPVDEFPSTSPLVDPDAPQPILLSDSPKDSPPVRLGPAPSRSDPAVSPAFTMKMRMTPDPEESIRCTVSGCGCVCFKPGSIQLRSCDRCGHGWVAHALEKLQLQAPPPSACGPVEVALPGLVFDLSSLVLYGAQAVPVRLKILLDRLYSVLSPEQVGHIIHTLGWSLGDYVRGYMLQYPGGRVLDRWLMVSPEEELLVLKQFLRFGETRPIVELMTLQRLATANHLSASPADPRLNPAPKSCRSNIRAFIERNAGTLGTPGTLRNARGESRSATSSCHFEKNRSPDNNGGVHHFENFPGGLSLLLPFHFPSSAFHLLDLAPPTKDLAPPAKLMQQLQKPSGTRLGERHRQEAGRGERESGRVSKPANGDPDVKIKPDPDAPSPGRSLWQQNHHHQQHQHIHENRHLGLERGGAKEEAASSRRKGRVCCGVCGKSFYDKGTLKIHYNAVHLKIKHRCTVSGCSMVFSSLRSRNRHSANPNPRLHTAPPPQAPPLLLPGHSASSPGSSPSLSPCDTADTSGYSVAGGGGGGARVSPPANQPSRRGSGDPAPKKKPRKSSTPVKIEREESRKEEES